MSGGALARAMVISGVHAPLRGSPVAPYGAYLWTGAGYESCSEFTEWLADSTLCHTCGNTKKEHGSK